MISKSKALPTKRTRLPQPSGAESARAAAGAVLAAIRSSGAKRIVDLGCGEGKLLRELLADRQFTEILGMDVSVRSLEIAHRRLKPRPAAGTAAGANSADSWGTDVPRRAAGELRCGRGCRSHRTPRPAPSGGVRAGRFRASPTGNGDPHDAQPRVQHRLGVAPRRRNAAQRSPVRVDEGRVRRVGGRRRETIRLRSPLLPVGPEEADVGAPSQMAVFEAALGNSKQDV